MGLGDIDRCWEAVKYARKPRIHTFVATSDIHLKYKLRKSRAEILKAAVEAVKHARGYCEDVEFSPEDASRSDFDYMCDVLDAVIDAGARTINIPDTVGYAIPQEWGQRIANIRERLKRHEGKDVLSVHCHNDLGQAVANSLTGVMNGARQVECTINGIGERAGNASLEEIVMALHTRKDFFDVDTRREDGGDLPHLAAALAHHRHPRPAEQGHRRRERLRARGGHPPGRRAQGEARPTRS